MLLTMMNIFYVYRSYFQFKIDDCCFKKNVFYFTKGLFLVKSRASIFIGTALIACVKIIHY